MGRGRGWAGQGSYLMSLPAASSAPLHCLRTAGRQPPAATRPSPLRLPVCLPACLPAHTCPVLTSTALYCLHCTALPAVFMIGTLELNACLTLLFFMLAGAPACAATSGAAAAAAAGTARPSCSRRQWGSSSRDAAPPVTSLPACWTAPAACVGMHSSRNARDPPPPPSPPPPAPAAVLFWVLAAGVEALFWTRVRPQPAAMPCCCITPKSKPHGKPVQQPFHSHVAPLPCTRVPAVWRLVGPGGGRCAGCAALACSLQPAACMPAAACTPAACSVPLHACQSAPSPPHTWAVHPPPPPPLQASLGTSLLLMSSTSSTRGYVPPQLPGSAIARAAAAAASPSVAARPARPPAWQPSPAAHTWIRHLNHPSPSSHPGPAPPAALPCLALPCRPCCPSASGMWVCRWPRASRG